MRKRHLIAAATIAAALALGVPSQAAAPATLSSVRDRVQTWLGANGFRGFHVDEVMAFTTNDYAAVSDKAGRPAFELLVAPDRSWLMEEPASMMWNTKYGMLAHLSRTFQPIPGMSMMWGGGLMMGSPTSWYDGGDGAVTSLARAVMVANSWLQERHPGEVAESDGRAYPGYFTLDTKRNGKTFGMVSVNRISGAIWYHGWHGRFVAEQQFTGS